MERFTWKPAAATLHKGFRIVQSQLENGKKRVYCKGRKPRRWTLSFRVGPEAMEEISRFYDDRQGAYDPFLWDDPRSGEVVTVRFGTEDVDIEGQWSSSEQGLCGFFSLVFEEVM